MVTFRLSEITLEQVLDSRWSVAFVHNRPNRFMHSTAQAYKSGVDRDIKKQCDMKLKSASLYKLGSLKYLQPKIEAMLVLISKIYLALN